MYTLQYKLFFFQIFFVTDPIRNVTNFTAYYLYKDRVNMTWSLDQNYRGQSKIAVDVGWHYDPSAKRSKYVNATNFLLKTLKTCNIIKKKKIRPAKVITFYTSLLTGAGLTNFRAQFNGSLTITTIILLIRSLYQHLL